MLVDLLRPNWLMECTLAELPLEALQERGIQALILDVDRTMLPRRQSLVPPLALGWLQEAKQLFPIHLLSNNPSRRRIGSVAAQLGLPFTTSAGKPRRAALRRVVAELGLKPDQIALVGDRLFTDVLAGNRLGLFTVLVRPIGPDGEPCPHDGVQNLEIRMSRWLGALVEG
jgi:HAD superfamily phosphatase (TIGR01668 family)